MIASSKKIGFLINDLSGGGAQKVILTLAESLATVGHDIHLFLVNANTISYIVTDQYQIHLVNPTQRITKAPLFKRFWQRRLLAKQLRDLVQQLEARNNWFDLFVAALYDASRIARAARLPNLYMRVDTNLSAVLENTLHRVGKKIARNRVRNYVKLYTGQRIIAVSEGIKQDVINNFNFKPASIRTIYNPVDYNKINELANQAEPALFTEDYIIHVGRFIWLKRHDLLLQALKRLNSPVKLVLLTDFTPELAKLINSYELNDRVICPGFQPNPYPWIKRAKLLVLSSDYEGLAMVILEALACNTPVVSTDCPFGPAEILTGELAHWLVPVNDVNALAAKIDEALNTEIKIPAFILDRFSPQVIVNQYLDLDDN